MDVYTWLIRHRMDLALSTHDTVHYLAPLVQGTLGTPVCQIIRIDISMSDSPFESRSNVT